VQFWAWRGVAAAGAVCVMLAGCSSTKVPPANQAKASKDPNAAPNFALKDANGDTVHLSDYRGKVVLLNFWATWCGPCNVEIPWLKEFENKYKDRGFAVLGVSLDDDGWSVVKPFISQKKLNYRVLLGDDKVADLYGGVDSLPTNFIIDREGRIDKVHVGLVSKSEYQNEIGHLLDHPVQTTRAAGSGAPAAPAARAD
jgi:peroxiredoxin